MKLSEKRLTLSELYAHCDALMGRCERQRGYLTLERHALEMRAGFHNLPSKYKRLLYLQYAVDRRAKKLIESADDPN
jgi:hypothetical protein